MLKVANSVISASRITGVLPVANGGTNASTASITSFNNITGFTASGTTGTTSTNLVFATTPTLVGDVNLSTGNLVIGTAGKGIDFSITSSGSGTMTSELLADYEEGTWTPTGNGFGGLTVTFATYTKTGRAVTVTFDVTFPSLAGNGDNAFIQSIPFIPATSWSGSGALGYRGSANMVALQVDLTNTSNGSINIYKSGTVIAQNQDVSLARIVGTVTYFV